MSNNDAVIEFLLNQLRQQLTNNPYKQQCEDLAHEVQSLKNQLRDASVQIKELHIALAQATGDVEAYKLIRKGEHGPEQSGCRKDDTHECHHNWRFVMGKSPAVCINCGETKAEECPHSFYYVITDGSAPFGTKVCKTCGKYF
jgi:hypothetical protein